MNGAPERWGYATEGIPQGLKPDSVEGYETQG